MTANAIARPALREFASVHRSRIVIGGATVALVALVLYPLFAPGYVLLLDAPFGPRYPFGSRFWTTAGDLQAGMPFQAILALAHRLPHNEMVGKVYFALALAAACLSMAAAVRGSTIGRLYAIFLFAVNPWVYDRLETGQIGVFAAYALLPLALVAAIRFADAPDARRLWPVALAAGAIGVFDPHALYVLPATLAALLAWRVGVRPGWRILRSRVGWGMALAGALVAVELYWLVPAFTLPAGPFSRISRVDLPLFATRSDPHFGIVFNTAALFGFWRSQTPIKATLPVWWLLAIAILAIACLGFWALWRKRETRWLAGALATIWLIAMFLSMGIAFGPTKPLWLFLFDHLPGFSGLREPQKASGLLVLVYAYLGAIGIDSAVRWWRGSAANQWLYPQVVAAALLMVPLLYGYREFAGLAGRLHPSQYPPSWHEAGAYIDEQNTQGGAVLVLPWHLYFPLPFSDGKTVANPAPVFFPGRVISGDNVEFGPIYSQSTNPVSGYIAELLRHRDELQNFGSLVAPLGVKYVALVRSTDFATYSFLSRAQDLRLVRKWDDLELYENQRFAGSFYSVSTLVDVPDISALLTLSQRDDFMSAAYRLAGDSSPAPSIDPAGAPPASVAYERRGLVGYRVAKPAGPWLVFAEPYSSLWRYGAQEPAPMVGAVNLFRADAGPADLLLTGVWLRLAACLISALTFAFAAFALVPTKYRSALLRGKN